MSKSYDPYRIMTTDQLRLQIEKAKAKRKELLITCQKPKTTYTNFQIKLQQIKFKSEQISDLEKELKLRNELNHQ